MLYDFFRDQGSIIAGVLALIAGILAYRAGRVQAIETRNAAVLQITVSQQKDDQEIDILRKSLAMELRQIVPIALAAHNFYKHMARRATPTSKITVRMVNSGPLVPPPSVYLGSVQRIGVLGNDGVDVMISYNLIEQAKEMVTRLSDYRTPDDVSLEIVTMIADYFLTGCQYAATILPRVTTGVTAIDVKDADFIKTIDEAARS